MELIDLSHCARTSDYLIKKTSLFAFLEQVEFYSEELLAEALGIEKNELKSWITEFVLKNTKTNKEKAFALRAKNPELSDRKIAKILKISNTMVSRYFKTK